MPRWPGASGTGSVFYPTPPEATRALLSVETFDGPIWEPACGPGHISKVMTLADLEPEVRRAILLMPTTFRQHWKFAPWTDRHQRRLAIADIVAERRLMYELTHGTLEKAAPKPAPSMPGQPIDHAEPTSPCYCYRMGLHRDTVASIRASPVPFESLRRTVGERLFPDLERSHGSAPPPE